MSIQTQVMNDIARFQPGTIFSYQELFAYQTAPGSVVKAMSRLVQSGLLRRFSKGNFYRPKQGVLGETPPSDNEKLKTVLFSGTRRTGYITGLSLYNRMGLTTQLPKTISVATEKARQKKDMGTLKINMIPARAPVSEDNRECLELLDALTDIKVIPDSNPSEILDVLSLRLTSFDSDAIQTLAEIAVNYYPPATRALLGMLLSNMGSGAAEILATTLNPLSLYKIGISEKRWADSREWNIR